jgi:hypothetical protein
MSFPIRKIGMLEMPKIAMLSTYNVPIAEAQINDSFAGVWILWKFYPVPKITKSQSESFRCRFL